MEGSRQTIELDCPPGGIRPWDLIEAVVKGTVLTLSEEDKKPHALFGMQTWAFQMPEADWEELVQPIIKPRIEALYHSGVIRYGSW